MEKEKSYNNYVRLKGYLNKIISKFFYDIDYIDFFVHVESVQIVFYADIQLENLPKCDFIKKSLTGKVLRLEVL